MVVWRVEIFSWQLSRSMEGKFRRRDEWVLRAAVCLTAGAPGWMSPGFQVGVGGDVAAGEAKVFTSCSRPKSRSRRDFRGTRISVSLELSRAGVRLSESNLEGWRRAARPRQGQWDLQVGRLLSDAAKGGRVEVQLEAVTTVSAKKMVPLCLTTEKGQYRTASGTQSQGVEQG
jgi:hypothetical protein